MNSLKRFDHTTFISYLMKIVHLKNNFEIWQTILYSISRKIFINIYFFNLIGKSRMELEGRRSYDGNVLNWITFLFFNQSPKVVCPLAFLNHFLQIYMPWFGLCISPRSFCWPTPSSLAQWAVEYSDICCISLPLLPKAACQ